LEVRIVSQFERAMSETVSDIERIESQASLLVGADSVAAAVDASNAASPAHESFA
jgi:hypothetical protein